MFGTRPRHGYDMIVKTKCGSANISKPRHGSNMVIISEALESDMTAILNSLGYNMTIGSKEFTIFSIFLIIF